MRSNIVGILLLVALVNTFAQPAGTNAPPRRSSAPIYSPEISPERKVTFRLRAPKATDVKVSGEWGGGDTPLAQNEDGVWTGTVGPLAPELYGYSFVVDGLRIADPGNPNVKPMRSPTTSILDIPGEPPLLHDWHDVPHGTVSVHQYYSEALQAWRRLHIYTPPGYETDRERYPVLYLFHGSGDNDATWSVLGRANVILDNLISAKTAKRMIIVMPDGHPLAGRITGVPGPDLMRKNLEAFADDVLKVVVPLTEKLYRVKANRENRAIAGLSMGGGQSIHIGLNHPELFNYVGGFSSFVGNAAQAEFSVFKSQQKPSLLWTACGKDDRLVENAKELSENLKNHQIEHQFLITEGNHSWPVWRKYLAQFAPLLFKN